MNGPRWLELMSGLAACVAGLLAIAFLLIGPIYATQQCTSAPGGETCAPVTGSANLLQVGIEPVTLVYLSLVSLLLLGIGSSAFLHSRVSRRVWQVCLWVMTGLLLACVMLGLASAGLLLVPALLLALVASVASLGIRQGGAGG